MIKEKKPFSVKVVAGQYKGKSIYLADIAVTRSTKSIIRSSVFNTLQEEIFGALFIEVFAGSATMGIEALSRGAEFGYFCEKDLNSYACIQKNIDMLKIKNAHAYNVDSFSFFPQLSQSLARDIRRIFYFDPPFHIREQMSDVYERCVMLIEGISAQSDDIVIIEHMSGYEFAPSIGAFHIVKQKRFGKTTITYYCA